MKLFFYTKRISNVKGFILPFTMLIATLVLIVMLTGANILTKQLFFSKMYRQSQAAYYAADDAISCALLIDETYNQIFPGFNGETDDRETYMQGVLDYTNTVRNEQGLEEVPSLDDITCARVPVFNEAVSGFEILETPYAYTINGTTTLGITSTFTMKIPLSNGSSRCAKVTVNKTPNFRQIIAQGYAACGSSADSVERAVVNTTIVN
jgi:hypothetical protein